LKKDVVRPRVEGRVRRRDFIKVVAGSAAGWPIVASAQQSERVRRVVMLLGFDEADLEAQSRAKEFRLGMRDLGWINGRNIQIEIRFAGSNPALIKEHVTQTVQLAPDVIVANSIPVMAALKPATSTIPIVFANVSNPVGQGFISNLARPGGNITGFSFIEPDIIGKWISLLRDVKPDLSRVALMFNPDTAPQYRAYLQSFKAQPLQNLVEIEAVHVRSVGEIEMAVAKLGHVPVGGLIAAADIFIVSARETVLKSADRHRVPVISPYRQFVVEGSLMSYGPDTGDVVRRSSEYVDRILKGAAPGDLPAQSPIKFKLAINLKTAKELGLSIRDSFLELADDVIE